MEGEDRKSLLVHGPGRDHDSPVGGYAGRPQGKASSTHRSATPLTGGTVFSQQSSPIPIANSSSTSSNHLHNSSHSNNNPSNAKYHYSRANTFTRTSASNTPITSTRDTTLTGNIESSNDGNSNLHDEYWDGPIYGRQSNLTSSYGGQGASYEDNSGHSSNQRTWAEWLGLN